MDIFNMKLPEGWYPKSKAACIAEIESMYENYHPDHNHEVGGIIPHAGWYFCGKLSVNVIKTLSINKPTPDLICVVGGHLGAQHPILVFNYDEAETPLGNIKIEKGIAKEVVKNLSVANDPNEGDNTVEINLPIIKYYFENTPVIAFRAPPSELAIQLGHALKQYALDHKLNILLLGAADLTHYGPNYGFTPHGEGEEALRWVKEENDRSLIDAMFKKDYESIINQSNSNKSSCSGGAIAAVCAYSEITPKIPALIDYYTSYDVYPNSSFVGYVGMIF